MNISPGPLNNQDEEKISVKCPKCRTENTAESKFCRECASPLTGPGRPEPLATRTIETGVEELGRGTTFAGRYEIVELLGMGGMGAVYRVFDKKLEEEVALKLIRPDIAASRKTIERFKNEIKIARKITDKHVCRMHDLGEAEGTSFITMEYVPGQDLRGLMKQTGQLSATTAVSIARQIAEGLSEAHKLGIIHRDLKPGNIMIDKDGQAKIMDFGIARSLLGKGMTGEGTIIGTPEYMSPEQVEGKEIDQRSDIYSLGIILYEMLIGRAPFEGETPFSIANKHKTEPPPVPKKSIPQIPEELNKLILRCLEKDKSKRYQTAEELVADLSAVEQALPTTDGALTRARTKIRTSREITVKLTPRKLILPAAIFIVLTLVIVAVLILFKPARGKIEKIAVLPLKDISVKRGEGYSIDGLHEALINEMNKIPSVITIGSRNVLRYKDSTESYAEIARALKADAIVESYIMQAEDVVQLTVKLYDGQTEHLIWGPRSYEKKNTEILSLFGEIALQIAREINAQLTAKNIENLSRSRKADPKAFKYFFDAYSQGLAGETTQLKTAEEISAYHIRILKLFKKSVEIDPQFALGYAMLASVYASWGQTGYMPREEAFQNAEEAARKALSLDDFLPDAHAALGLVMLSRDWDLASAGKEYQRVLDLGPPMNRGNTPIIYLSIMGRFEEAIALQKSYIEANPLYPDYGNLCWTLGVAGRNDEAITVAQKCIDLNLDVNYAHYQLLFLYSSKGECAKAMAEMKYILPADPAVAPDPNMLTAIAIAYAQCGDRKKAEEALEKRQKLPNFDPADLGLFYAILGEKELALAALEKAYEQRSPLMLWLKVDPGYDTLREDPRFKDLLKKVGFEK